MAVDTKEKEDASVEELEDILKKETPHPLGERETNAYPPEEAEPEDTSSNENYGWSRDNAQNEEAGEQQPQKSWKERYDNINKKYKDAKEAKKKLDKAKKGKQAVTKQAEKGAEKVAEKGVEKGAEKAGQTAVKGGARAGARVGGRVAVEGGAAAVGAAPTAGASVAIAAGMEVAIQEAQLLAAFRSWKSLKKYLKDNKKKILLFWKIFAGVALGVLAIILLIITVLNSIIMEKYGPDFLEESSQLLMRKQGPDSAAAGARLDYTITATYNGTAEDITISDEIPAGTTFLTASQPSTYNPATRTVTWHSQEISPTNPSALTVTLSLVSNINNDYIFNIAKGIAIPATPTVGENIPPSTNDCGNPDYRRYMNMLPGARRGLNYGDPQCNFTEDALQQLLQQLDPADAVHWYCLAGPESGYNPNAFLANSTSGRGAYGLYQMNPPGGNQYDNGYVVWTLQVSNAINYRRNVINNSWAYWDGRSLEECNIDPLL